MISFEVTPRLAFASAIPESRPSTAMAKGRPRSMWVWGSKNNST